MYGWSWLICNCTGCHSVVWSETNFLRNRIKDNKFHSVEQLFKEHNCGAYFIPSLNMPRSRAGQAFLSFYQPAKLTLPTDVALKKGLCCTTYLAMQSRQATTSSRTRQHFVSPEISVDTFQKKKEPSHSTDQLQNLDFTDHKRAFKHMSLWELSRSLIVLSVCSYQTFSAHSLKASLHDV